MSASACAMDRRTELGNADRKEMRGRSGSIDELLKRKREEQGDGRDIEDIFKRSKKTVRSPDTKKGTDKGEEEEWKIVLERMEEMKRELREDIREEGKRQEKAFRKEMEEVKQDLRAIKEREEEWKREKDDLRKEMEDIGKRVKELEINERTKGKAGCSSGGEDRVIEDRVRELEDRLERTERERRKGNIIIRETMIKNDRRREAVEEIMEVIGAKVMIEQIRRLGGNKERGTEMLWVKLGSEEQRREVMLRKRNLGSRRERITEDMTWRERKMKWRLEEIAREEIRKGKRAWVGYGRIKIEEEWWLWDEREKVLKKEKREMRGERQERLEEGKGGNDQ